MPAAWIEAAARASSAAVAYPDPDSNALREAIGETFHLDKKRILCGAGLMECLHTLALAYLDPGDQVIVPEHAFVFFRHIAQVAGAEVKLVPERNLRVDTSSILEAVNESTKMVIFANPANPHRYLSLQRVHSRTFLAIACNRYPCYRRSLRRVRS